MRNSIHSFHSLRIWNLEELSYCNLIDIIYCINQVAPCCILGRLNMNTDD